MKKSLSLLVAFAMVFSMFATVVSAAEVPNKPAGEYLNELGVIKGNGTDLKEDQTWKRQDIVVLLSRLLGVEDAAKAAAKTHEFTDVTDANYDGYISWAVEEGLVQGKGNGKFGYGDELKNQEFYALVLRAFKVEVAYDDVPAKAVELGLAAEGLDFAAVPTRGATYESIVTALYTEVPGAGKTLGELLGLVEGPAVAATQTGAKLVTVKFNKAVDVEKVKFAVKNGNSTREVVKTTFSEDKKSAVLEFSTKLQDGASTVTVSGVTESDLVSEFTAVAEKIEEIVFTSDKLALGTITSGTNTNAADYKNVSVGYKIVNQFEEDVTNSSGGTLQFQVGKAGTTATATNGVLKVTADTTANFQIGETVFVNAILNLGTYGITTNKSFTVGQQAVVDSVEILSVYHPENKEITTSSTFEDYYVLVEAKDQYGNNVTVDQFKAGVFAFTTNHTLFTIDKDKVRANVGPNRDKLGIQLTTPSRTPGFVFEGTNTIRITSLFGQKTDTLDVVVKKAPTLTSITLQQPTETVVPNTTVKVPFEAFDQNGAKIEKYSDLDGFVNITTNHGASFKLLQDYATKKGYLEWAVGSTTGDAFLTATVVGTANTSQLQVKVVDKNDPRALAGLKDIKTTVIAGSKIKIEPKHVIVKDQFDRNMKLEDMLATHTVTISVYDGAYNNDPLVVTTATGTAASGELNNTLKAVELEAVKKGTATVKIQLVKNAVPAIGNTPAVPAKEIATYTNFAITVVEAGSVVSDSYTVTDIPKVHASTLDRGVEVKVAAKTSGGTELPLPTSEFTVTPVGGELKYDAASNKLYAETSVNFVGDNETKKATYIVTILATSTSIVKEVTLTKEELAPAKFELQDANNLKGADGVIRGSAAVVTDLSKVIEAVKVKDQFGVELKWTPLDAALGLFTATISDRDGVEAVNNGGLVSATPGTGIAGVTGVDLGDSYTVTFTSVKSGERFSVKVVADSN